MGRLGIGLQLYTLRDDMEKDLEGTLRHVAKLGYEGVEFAGYYGKPAAELKQLLDELGLKAFGSHVSLERFRKDLQGELDYLKTIGAKYAICPYVGAEERESADQWKALIAECQAIAVETNKQGLQFLYHNHDFEFHYKVNDEFVFDAMFAKTGEDAINVEMDVCWVQFAGQDPLAYIAKYAGRLPLLHFKDFTKDAEGKLVTLELGLGDVPLEKVIKAAEQAGVEWLVVEQDHCQKPPLTSVENSLNWVKEHYTNVHN
ncbi:MULTISPECIES: sugar phosphate isomerase/epimerase [unclassified Paenibacillus]|uniref:sugar phosphate isomerase/epimerase family protein n=1 Tax=unclassified Paenibacillus TaxID=185978 RepID=UPI000648044F|nr:MULTISPECIES: sugar phosphate isomerase/epimerase [unclassified Paenibacillus]MDF2645326.1 sugar phosphate isomerase [Paenibacillus sp.]MDQ0898150.1 sugar phosphate isomerase/epimerase [Paenibacillus sp. V4I7]MDQ0915843.1 sugar phosphate isomerase/epimerase [Paenibacillus sp. V4I5]